MSPKKGRGTASNPANRFETLWITDVQEHPDDPAPRTHFLRDDSRSIISYNDSDDVPFEASINPYRGCEHGCVYCYARPTHEFLGFSAGLDFETRIVVKENAPELLEKELLSPKWKAQTIALSGNTDAYQPGERKLQITRRCLEVLARFRNPVGVITKNNLVTRDVDLLGELASFQAVSVFLSITTLDAELARVLEPRTSHPGKRLEAIRKLSDAGIPCGVMTAPVIPGLTDQEIPAIVSAAVEAGAQYAGFVVLRLPGAVEELFAEWLEDHLPDRKTRVLNRIRSLRGGDLHESRISSRMRGEGIFAEQIQQPHQLACRDAGIAGNRPELETKHFRRPGGTQLDLFEE